MPTYASTQAKRRGRTLRCDGCGAAVSRWNDSSLCPACHVVAGASLPVPPPRRPNAALWLWITDQARTALATGDLALILRAYRAATGASQRQLGESLGYDPTYISMIETGRREITDIATRLRIARRLGIPPHTVGVTDPDDADFVAMLQFGESTIRLAVLARQAGHGTEAVNELWPLVARLEARVAEGHVERDVLLLLARARAELGVSLGYVLPEERLVSAVRWTSRALALAEHLDDQDLLAFALRVHGNELRKVERTAAAVARLTRSAILTRRNDLGTVIIQLARAAGELGDPELFDEVIGGAQRLVDGGHAVPPLGGYALHEVHIRGLVHTGRARLAADLLDLQPAPLASVPPQWQAIHQITVGEVLIAHSDDANAEKVLIAAIDIAERHRLPHQLQRAARAADRCMPAIARIAQRVLRSLLAPPPNDDRGTLRSAAPRSLT